MTPITLIFVLLVVYQAKHFIADYLTGHYQLSRFNDGFGSFIPLLSHALTHSALTFIIALFLVPAEVAFVLAVGDGLVCFGMDSLKAGSRLGRYKALSAEEYRAAMKALDHKNYPDLAFGVPAAQKKLREDKHFWWVKGFDGLVHHLTHYGIIYILVMVHCLAFGL